MIAYTICRKTKETLKRECYEHQDDIGIEEAAPVLARLVTDHLKQLSINQKKVEG
jgi:hypothetical protein